MHNAAFQVARDVCQDFYLFIFSVLTKTFPIWSYFNVTTFYCAKYGQWMNVEKVKLDPITVQCFRYYLIPLIHITVFLVVVFFSFFGGNINVIHHSFDLW